MYLVSEAVRLIGAVNSPKLFADENEALDRYRQELESSTRFIPNWVKICVALALASALWSAGSALSLPSGKGSARRI